MPAFAGEDNVSQPSSFPASHNSATPPTPDFLPSPAGKIACTKNISPETRRNRRIDASHSPQRGTLGGGVRCGRAARWPRNVPSRNRCVIGMAAPIGWGGGCEMGQILDAGGAASGRRVRRMFASALFNHPCNITVAFRALPNKQQVT